MNNEETQVATVQSGNLLAVISQAVADPRMDTDKMRALLDMHKEIMIENRRVAFVAALALLQAELPQIRKDGRIVVKGVERSRFARLEDLDAAIRPLLAQHGFSFSFNEESADGNNRRYSATLAHKDGHAEVKYITLPLDVSDYRSGCQSAGSTNAYARRYLIKNHLNVVEIDEDTDGHNLQPISADQAKDLETLIIDAKADRARFLAYMGVNKIDEILSKDYGKACTALESKRRGSK